MRKVNLVKSLLLFFSVSAAEAAIYDVQMHSSTYFRAFVGPINMMDFRGVWDSETGQGQWTGTTAVTLFQSVMHYTQSFTMDQHTAVGMLYPYQSATCTDNDGISCQELQSVFTGLIKNTAINPPEVDIYKNARPFTHYHGWAGQWTIQINRASIGGEVQYMPIPMNVFLHLRAMPAVPVPAAAWLFGSGLIGLIGTARRRDQFNTITTQ